MAVRTLLDAPRMVVSSRTPEGWPNKCPVCGHDLRIDPSPRTLDAPCPHCGNLLWFASSGDVAPILDASRLPADTAPIDFDVDIPDQVIELIPQSVARENLVLPIAAAPDAVVVAVTDPTDVETIEKLRFILNRHIHMIHVTSEWLRDQFHKHYGDDAPDGTS